MKKWKTLSKETILSTNKFLTVEKHSVQLPDGKIIPDWQWVITPDFTNVVAITSEYKFITIRQYKYGLDGISLSPVGGYMESGEDPLESAKRELLEETGFIADKWISIGRGITDSNRGCGTAYFFLATEAHKLSEPNSGDLEEQEILFLTKEEVSDALDRGEFKTLPWATCVALALRKL
jgi:ADP-ribose pyrophosphatase